MQDREGTLEHQGMEIYFSSDARNSPVVEKITIAKTTTQLKLKVKAYGTGSGTVSWSYDGVDPCPNSVEGCESCEDYGKKIYYFRNQKYSMI